MTSTGFPTLTTRTSYWQVSRAPRYSLLLALPLLVFYQVLALLLTHGERSIRNGADVILQALFTAVAGAWGAPPFSVCLIGPGLGLDPRRARGPGRAWPPRLAPARRRLRGGPRRRRGLLGVSLYRPLRRPLAAVFVRVPDGRRAVLFGVVSRARIRHHGVDARVVRRPPAGDAIIRASNNRSFAARAFRALAPARLPLPFRAREIGR